VPMVCSQWVSLPGYRQPVYQSGRSSPDRRSGWKPAE
jgi:hypothetical protein